MNAFMLCLWCHLVGDFLLQNHWMQQKSKSTLHCGVHVAVYSLGFILLAILHLLPWWACGLILAEHFAQDRWALHLRWMEFYGHSTPDLWPTGPLCVDQAMHISFIGAVLLFVQ